jgi:MinD superfamily P-loop ATPase
MKEIAVISGKGGTGKTVLTACFAALAKNACFADCDVDAADLHLLLHPSVKERYEFRSGETAYINKKQCQQCRKCIIVCRYQAISEDFTVDPILCEGCGLCTYICPVNAVCMRENLSGEWYISSTRYGPFVHARLGIAEENSGKLVTQVRQSARKIAEEKNKDYVIIDGPPGIGCPVIACLANVDLALIVTEPTLSGRHDMERIADVTGHFGISTKVVINKYDINLKNTEDIKKICRVRNIEVLAELPFSEDVSNSLVKGVPVVEFSNGQIAAEISDLWDSIKK